jgi:hypothetical protein
VSSEGSEGSESSFLSPLCRLEAENFTTRFSSTPSHFQSTMNGQVAVWEDEQVRKKKEKIRGDFELKGHALTTP